MKKRVISIVLSTLMAATVLAGCGGGGSATPDAGSSTADTAAAPAVEEAKPDENGVYQADGYTYGTKFYSDEPVTYTMFFNDNDAYPIQDSWYAEGGIFDAITKATNVKLDLTVVNNADYSDKVSLAINSGETPMIIPKIYDETPYVSGGGVVPVSDYTQYMPNYTGFYNDYNMKADVDTLLQEDGKYYRLPGLKETALQDYTFLLRKDIFDAAGYKVEDLEKDWTWDDFADVLIGVKKYMVDQGMVGENDYIWSDRWCGADSGYGSGGCLLNLISNSYGIYTSWSGTGGRNGGGDLYFDTAADEFKLSATSDAYKEYMNVVQKLVSNKILDPETWSQQDSTADNKFYTGKTALLMTNRSQTTAQVEGLESQLGKGNFEVYRCVIPKGTTNFQAENSRLECGLMVSKSALDDLGEADFIKMMRFIDWLWYSKEGLTLTKWGIEGEDGTYTVDADGHYALNPGYYCGGLSIAQTSDDQEDMRLKYGFACGNFMYSGTTDLLTSNFSEDLQAFYDRQNSYRELKPLDPVVALSEDDKEQMNLWATPLFDTENTWTLKFAMGQADVNADWDTYVAEVEAQNAQNVLDMYNNYYKGTN
jgi:putative aldouronate transport system substrate-binding protein